MDGKEWADSYADCSNSSSVEGHRLEDEITSFVSEATTTPAEMLDVRALYEYDFLPT